MTAYPARQWTRPPGQLGGWGLLGFLLGGCDQSRDQSLIRAKFDLPPAAEVIEYASSPPPGGWFGRED